jgi:hypothetical protein
MPARIIDIAEVWPNRLRASGMGFSYGIVNLGKITRNVRGNCPY